MSLDVYLTLQDHSTSATGSGIFVRESGRTVEITRAEWNAKFPDREPVVVVTGDGDGTVYHGNITHNLNTMAEAAGVYKFLWRPSEYGITTASQLIEPLRAGLERLLNNPESYLPFNPSNGWGDYSELVAFVMQYLAACERWPMAEVSVWR